MLTEWPTYFSFFLGGPFLIAMSFRPSPPVLYWAGVGVMLVTGMQLLYQVWSKYFLVKPQNGTSSSTPNSEGRFSSSQWENEPSEYAFNNQTKRFFKGGATVPQTFSGPNNRAG